MDIGTAIKKMRLRHGISQKELAFKVGISTNALCSIEKGYSFPKKETITAICDAIGIEKVYFLLMTITEEDVPEKKREVFDALREPLIKIFEKESK